MSGAEVRLTAPLAAVVLAVALPLGAQNAEPPRAPRIIDPPVPRATAPAADVEPADLRVSLPAVEAARRPPNAARLAPLPEDRARPDDGTEEIIVIGQGWRLPDLGSEWRARQKETANEGRFSATVLPLYDPAEPPLHSQAFTTSAEERRHGYIELFRLRFGRRSTD
jgi:hypothetical protein